MGIHLENMKKYKYIFENEEYPVVICIAIWRIKVRTRLKKAVLHRKK
jgi:hypothetical protein